LPPYVNIPNALLFGAAVSYDGTGVIIVGDGVDVND
jgi:hypothetical protein